MEVTLTPTLSDLQKSLLRDWLIGVLNDAELDSRSLFPVSYLSLYIDKRAKIVASGTWQISTDRVYLAARDTQGPPLSERLPILLTLSQLCEPSGELTKACSGAITRYLLGEYRSLSSNLIVSTVPSSGIAFSCDNRIASLLGNEWMLPSGEIVDVSGPDWVVCASEVPATTEDNFDHLGVGTGGETIDDPPINSEYQFSVGQRVHWSGGDFGEHDGVVSSTPDRVHNFYNIVDDQNRTWTCLVQELRAI